MPRLRESLPGDAARFRRRRPPRRREPLRAALPRRARSSAAWRQPPGCRASAAPRPSAWCPGSAGRSTRRHPARPGDVRESPVLGCAPRPPRAPGRALWDDGTGDGRGGSRQLLFRERLPAGAHGRRAPGSPGPHGRRPDLLPDGLSRGQPGRVRERLQLPDRDRVPGGRRECRACVLARPDPDRNAAGLVQGRAGASAHGQPGAGRRRHRRRAALRRSVRWRVGGVPGVPPAAARDGIARDRAGAREQPPRGAAGLQALSPGPVPEPRGPGDAGEPRVRRPVLPVPARVRWRGDRCPHPHAVGVPEPGAAGGGLGEPAGRRPARAAELVRLRAGRNRGRRGGGAAGLEGQGAFTAAGGRVDRTRVDPATPEDARDERAGVGRARGAGPHLDAAVPGRRPAPHDHHGPVHPAGLPGAGCRVRADRVPARGPSGHRPRVARSRPEARQQRGLLPRDPHDRRHPQGARLDPAALGGGGGPHADGRTVQGQQLRRAAEEGDDQRGLRRRAGRRRAHRRGGRAQRAAGFHRTARARCLRWASRPSSSPTRSG